MKKFFLSFFMAFCALVTFEIGSGGPSTLAIYLYYDFDSQTKGIVTGANYSSGFRGSPSAFKVHYQYSVNGYYYLSKYINFYGFESDVDINRNRFFIGKEVDVYFDSDFPHVAVLEKTPIGKVVLLQIFFVFCIAFYPFVRIIYRRFWS